MIEVEAQTHAYIYVYIFSVLEWQQSNPGPHISKALPGASPEPVSELEIAQN